jgi:hypothetical protein
MNKPFEDLLNKKQKLFLFIPILLAFLISLYASFFLGGASGYATITCEETKCYNPLSSCDEVFSDKTNCELCVSHPELCEPEYVLEGETIGTQPPFLVDNLTLLSFILVLLGGVGAYYVRE